MNRSSILTSEIWNCENAFEFECPMKWAELTSTEQQGVRHCNKCDQLVHLCTTPEDFVKHGNTGNCVAIHQSVIPGRERRGLLGKMRPDAVKRILQESRDRKTWWQNVLDAEPQFNHQEQDVVRQHLELVPDDE